LHTEKLNLMLEMCVCVESAVATKAWALIVNRDISK